MSAFDPRRIIEAFNLLLAFSWRDRHGCLEQTLSNVGNSRLSHDMYVLKRSLEAPSSKDLTPLTGAQRGHFSPDTLLGLQYIQHL